tara:strand:- start:2138 stop:5548 length:3411 start_codon:yes stop_codon:yes gene_type:complete
MIRNYLEKVRLLLLKDALYYYLLFFLIVTSLFIFSIIQLETVFFFSPQFKITAFTIVIVGTIGFGFFWFVVFERAKKNGIHKYTLENLATRLGRAISSNKSDIILNALQLESTNQNSESKELSRTYIQRVYKTLDSSDIAKLQNNEKRIKIKIILFIVWALAGLIFFLNYSPTSDAFYRLTKIHETFSAPKPFQLLSMSGDIHIIGGDDAEIYIQAYPTYPDTLHLKLTPSQVSTQKRDSLELDFFAIPVEDGIFHFKLPKLFQDYIYYASVESQHFWEAWGTVSSRPDTIFVTDRPKFEKFLITTQPPPYSKLKTTTQEGNIALIEGLKGSIAKVEITSNRALEESYININDTIINLSIDYNKANGQFPLIDEGKFTVNLVDKRGITNRDPIPYTISILPDFKPSISIIKPSPIIELGDDQIVEIELEVNDDYGFTDLQLAYEVRRPTYLLTDPYVSMFIVNNLMKDSLNQKINFEWDLTGMQLMPDDEVHFHLELTDNDNISGPKKTTSNNYIIQVPSLTDLYENIEDYQNNLADNMIDDLKNIDNIKDRFKDLELKMLKKNEIDWDEEQSIKSLLEETLDEIENLEETANKMENIAGQAEKHKLFSPALIEKFKELSELINEILPNDMLKSLQNLDQSLENIDLNSLKDILKDLSQNMDEIESGLDRYLEIFKRLQAEQKLDEISKRMQQLFEQQKAIDEQISDAGSEEKDNLSSIAQEELRNIEEFNNILSQTEDAAKTIEQFSQETANSLKNLIDSDPAIAAQSSLEETRKSLMNADPSRASFSSNSSLKNIERMMDEISTIQNDFNKREVQEMVKKFQNILQDVLYLSAQEEELINSVNQLSRNSPRLRDYARKQQLIQDQLNRVTQKMLQLSSETFAITPDIGRGIGKANAAMEKAKSKLTSRNLSEARSSQSIAMEGLNEASLGLFNSMSKMQSSGSASGFEQFLQMMQQMAGKQQGINQQGMQLALGQMAAASQQQLMQQMLDSQNSVRKSLEQLIKETRYSGQKGMGDLSGMVTDMEEVIQDLQRKKYDRKTQDRQQRILSRMLDSQTSMTQRGEKDKRKSYTAKKTTPFQGPAGLPNDLGQRENLALQALNKALRLGYSNEYQTMIKHYFNSLIIMESDTSRNDN